MAADVCQMSAELWLNSWKKKKSYCKELLKNIRNKCWRLDVSGFRRGHNSVVGGNAADLSGRGRMQEDNTASPKFHTSMVWLFCKGFLEVEQKFEEVILKKKPNLLNVH